MTIPQKYSWLMLQPTTLMIKNALELFGVTEQLGTKNNPIIMAWAKEVGTDIANIYKADAIPWCGLFIALVAKRSNKQVVKDPLWALNWGTFGNPTDVPMLGDVLVFVRKTSNGKTAGHVGLYIGEDSTCYHVLGGNQADTVCIMRIPKTRLYICRRPKYNKQPNSVKVIRLANSGAVSVSEQ